MTREDKTEPQKKKGGRWRIVLLGFAAVVCVAFLLTRGYFWSYASPYSPNSTYTPPVPVMSMSEYRSVIGSHPRPYILKYTKGERELTLFGISNHTSDPNDPDIKKIDQLFHEIEPDVCLVEGRLGFWFAGYKGLVKQFGETGAVCWLARQSGAKTFTLELSLEDEVQGVLKSHPPEHTALFYVLRPYFGARRGGPIDNPENFIGESLRKRTKIKGIDQTIKTVADIDKVWKRDFSELPDWRDCDDRFGWPGALNDVAATANSVRNDHWVKVLDDLMNATQEDVDAPKKIFATVGCSHAVRLQPALDSMFDAAVDNPRPNAVENTN